MTEQEPSREPDRQRIPGYTLLRKLGRGSMGAVLLARQDSLGREVAVKVLAPRFARNERYVRRFFREARAAARLSHPNLVSAIDVGESGLYKYFVMEYVDGPTVAQVLARGGAMAPERAVAIAAQVARALDHAFVSDLVHRDVKPGNIILSTRGVAKLCDLGLAKELEEGGSESHEGQTLGTPDYIAPEQARGEADIDTRADIYALGATLFHMLTGQVPFPGPNPAVVMAKHITEPVPDPCRVRPEIPPSLAAVVRRMMAKDRLDRYQTPAEVLQALAAADDGTNQTAADGPAQRVIRRRRRF